MNRLHFIIKLGNFSAHTSKQVTYKEAVLALVNLFEFILTGQRPLIFYTNGYDTWFWDDTNYAPRKVYSVFAKRDMERIVNRRGQKKQFRKLNINEEITNRAYQKVAVQRACEEYGKNKRKVLWVMATGSGKTSTTAIISAGCPSVRFSSRYTSRPFWTLSKVSTPMPCRWRRNANP